MLLLYVRKSERKRVSGIATVREHSLLTQPKCRQERGHMIINKFIKKIPPTINENKKCFFLTVVPSLFFLLILNTNFAKIFK